MKITIWSDYECPFCYIGKAHLDEAMRDFEYKDEVEIEHKSFLLTPDAEYEPGKSYAESFSKLKGMPEAQAQAMLKQVTDMGAQAGLDINYDTAKMVNTTDAHRVFQYAKNQGKGNAFFERFYKAHFSEGAVISDHDVIIRLAVEVGLDAEAIREVLDHATYAEEVNKDIEEARNHGVQGVPYFIFENKYAVSGAQPVASFKEVLKTVKEEG